MRARIRFAAACAACILLAAPALAQFGLNKIAYDRFDWKVYSSPHFDVYYYGEQEESLEDVISYAESKYLDLSKKLDHELRFRVPLVIYKTHQEFRQTNITLSVIPEGVGAFAESVENRMVLPIDLPPDELFSLIGHELAHIFQYSIFFEGYLGRSLRGQGRAPIWFMEGMASYLADDEDSLDGMYVRDAVVNDVIPPIQLFPSGFLAYRYGHAVFDFIEAEHGIEGFRNFIYEYRKILLTGGIGKAIKESFGYEVDEFNRRFNRYLRQKYFPILLEKKVPADYGTEISFERGGRKLQTIGPTVSPSGELVAALTTPNLLDVDLVVLSADDGSKVRNLTKGWTTRYEELTAEYYRGKRDLSWSPAGDRVASFARVENQRRLFVFDALKGKVVHEIDLGDIYEATSPAFSPDGRRVAFEGNLGGVIDLFEYDLETGETRNLTGDTFYDTNPWYAPDGRSVLYNRRIGEFWKVFSVDVRDPSRKTQLTFGPFSDLQPSYSRDGGTIYFSSDRDPDRIFNLYSLDLGTGTVRRYTDVVSGVLHPVEMAERDGETYLVFSAFHAGRFRLFRMPLREAIEETPIEDLVAQPVEAEPFEPPLQLSVDEEDKRDYRLQWVMDRPLISVGVADDGTFLSDVGLVFTDLLGDHRVTVFASSVSSYSNVLASYVNLKRRTNWGASVFDFRDYFLTATSSGLDRDQSRRSTGATFFVQYPLNRFYRVDAAVGYLDQSQDYIQDFSPFTGLSTLRLDQRLATAQVGLVGDTTRRQRFGPFQGKRFSIEVLHGANIGGDFEGDLTRYTLDFRGYKQLTTRSVLAWRLAGLVNESDRDSLYGFGGINQLRGYEYREFFGSQIAWTNLELRFPIADSLYLFRALPLGPIRGSLFLDVGGAKLDGDLFYDPVLRGFREPNLYPFKVWDSENDRLQDVRASYGFGINTFFAGLQWHWVWAKRIEYTQYLPEDPLNPFGPLVKTKGDTGGTRMEFYLLFDW